MHSTLPTPHIQIISDALKRHASIGFLAILPLIGACRATAPLLPAERSKPENFPNHTVSEILDHLPDTPPEFSELYAEMSVSISSPKESGNFSTRIAYREGDSLLIRVRFKLGIEGARVLIAGDSAYVFDRIHNEVVIGTIESIAPLLPGAILGTDLVSAALDFIIPDPLIAWTVESDALYYHLISPDRTYRFVIDPGLWRIVQIEQRDMEGMIIEQRWYQDFRQFNQHVLPRRLQISRPPEDTRLSMFLRKVDTEPESLSFELNLKDDTRRILVQ